MGLEGRKCKERDSCVAACVNTLMDRDDCPHFFDGVRTAEEAWLALKSWLRENHNKELMLFPFTEDPRESIKAGWNESAYMLIYDNTNDQTHAAIFKGDERIFDPAWISCGVKGPVDGSFWIVGVIVDYTA